MRTVAISAISPFSARSVLTVAKSLNIRINQSVELATDSTQPKVNHFYQVAGHEGKFTAEEFFEFVQERFGGFETK